MDSKSRTRRRPKSAGKKRTPPQRRQYDSPLRRQRAAETRERIVAAGSAIVHGLPTWDWQPLTFGAVGARAGVSERTVHRHFANERALREAVLQRLVAESGVKLDKLELPGFADTAARVFTHLSSFTVSPETTEPAFAALDRHRREALLGAVVRASPDWSVTEQQMATAMLDMMWNVPTYERLITAWKLDSAQAIRATTWVIGLIEQAIRDGRRPGGSRRR
jgi:AcrR family transcriptional regulator